MVGVYLPAHQAANEQVILSVIAVAGLALCWDRHSSTAYPFCSR